MGIIDFAREIRNQLAAKEIELKLKIFQSADVHSNGLIKTGVLVALTALAILAGYLIGNLKTQYAVILVALPFAVVFILFVQEKLNLAPVIILFSAAFIPIEFSTGTGSKLVISLVFAAGFLVLWLLRRMLVDRAFDFVRTPFNVPVIGFGVTTLVSLVWSMIFRDPLVYTPPNFVIVQLASAIIMIVSPALLLMMGNLVQEAKYLQWMAWIMLALGALGALSNYSSINLPTNTNGLASMWIEGLATGLALFDEKLPRKVRIPLLALALVWVIWDFVINLSWIAGWLPGFVMGFVVVAIRSKRLFLGVVLVLAFYIGTHITTFEAWFGDESVTSGDTRMLAWETNWRYTKDHLLFGMGPAGYALYYMTYNPLDAMATHNNYIDLISQTGIVGSVFYMSIFGLLLWRGWVVYGRVKGRRDFLEAMSVVGLGGTFGCLVIMAFGDWLLPFAYTQTISGFSYSVYNWLFMGMIVSLDVITRPKETVTR